MTAAPLTPVVPAHRWNSLQLLKLSRAVILALDGLLLIAVVAATHVHRDAMQTVGRNAAPSIIAAQHIKSALADMDANAANELLTLPGVSTPALATYESRRVEAAEALIAAAENITYGESERAPIRTLQVGFGTYERLIQKARDLHAIGNPAAAAAYHDAAVFMDGTLLPAADSLDEANNDVLERTYRSQSSASFAARALIVLAGLLALLALVAAQVFLSQRMRRTLNPLLLVATLVTLALALHALQAMTIEQHHLKVAREDAFTSLHALWRARALAYAANSDESRYLLDPAHAQAEEEAFQSQSAALARLPVGEAPDAVLFAEGNGKPVNGFTGYLADELNNITFPGEREAAIKTLAAWENYRTIDARIRQQERAGQHRQAVELCLGSAPGQSDYAFNLFDDALKKTLAINQEAFDTAVDRGLDALGGLETGAFLAAAVIAALVFFGFAGRIREYQ